jgi:hypothetical protein
MSAHFYSILICVLWPLTIETCQPTIVAQLLGNGSVKIYDNFLIWTAVLVDPERLKSLHQTHFLALPAII